MNPEARAWLGEPGLCVALPLLQVIRKSESQRVPRWWKINWDVPFNASLPDELQHAYLQGRNLSVTRRSSAAVLHRSGASERFPDPEPWTLVNMLTPLSRLTSLQMQCV